MTATVSTAGAGTAPGPERTKAKRRSGGGLSRYLIIRALLIIPTIFILVTVVFFLMRSTGDPITASLGGKLPPAQLHERIAEAGFDLYTARTSRDGLPTAYFCRDFVCRLPATTPEELSAARGR